MDALSSIKDAAGSLACSEAMLRKWIHQGKLPRVKVGGLVTLAAVARSQTPLGQSIHCTKRPILGKES